MPERYSFDTEGTCSSSVSFTVDAGTLRDVEFEGGCPGNLLGLARLLEGMELAEARKRLAGIPCGGKPTSCPDQLARALSLLAARRSGTAEAVTA
ncbi:MAG: TIGR03905 family TSCPD domain-containing protein [Spirochaetaceae bacterium]|nr:TIGR03905 family TSCPD domain-containing protein [Spirochaetaceae bacterium]